MLLTTFSRAVIVSVLLLVGQTSWAASTLVAVAANFSKPMTEIAAEFKKDTGHTAKLSFGCCRLTKRRRSG
jgi:molybdate transport system substrate-binding protein